MYTGRNFRRHSKKPPTQRLAAHRRFCLAAALCVTIVILLVFVGLLATAT